MVTICQMAPCGQPPVDGQQVVRRRRRAADDAEHDRELQRLGEQALVVEAQALVEVAGVVDLQLRLDVELTHPGGEATHARGRVEELAGAEAHRAGVERGHPRAQLDELLALLERHPEPDPGRHLDEDRAPLGDEVHRAPGDGEIPCGAVVLVPQVDVRDRRAQVVGPLDRVGDLVRLGGQRRVVALERDRPGRGDGEDDAHACGSGCAMTTSSRAGMPVRLVTLRTVPLGRWAESPAYNVSSMPSASTTSCSSPSSTT